MRNDALASRLESYRIVSPNAMRGYIVLPPDVADEIVSGLAAPAAPAGETPHTCHDMNPPFPGPCAACAREALAYSHEEQESRERHNSPTPPPLSLVDGRLACPKCGAKADLIAETPYDIWECPSCQYQWASGSRKRNEWGQGKAEDWRRRYDDACAVLKEPDSTNDGGTDLADAVRVLRDNYNREVDENERLRHAMITVVTKMEAWRATDDGHAIELICEVEDALRATLTEEKEFGPGGLDKSEQDG